MAQSKLAVRPRLRLDPAMPQTRVFWWSHDQKFEFRHEMERRVPRPCLKSIEKLTPWGGGDVELGSVHINLWCLGSSGIHRARKHRVSVACRGRFDGGRVLRGQDA